MVLNTTPDVGDLRELLSSIYDDIYGEYVARNPLYTPGTPFRCVCVCVRVCVSARGACGLLQCALRVFTFAARVSGYGQATTALASTHAQTRNATHSSDAFTNALEHLLRSKALLR